MKKKLKQNIINKEEVAEDWCFACKDGGTLRVCDYEQCLKSYHPSCVGKAKSFLNSEKQWNCEWHTCSLCKKSSDHHCFTCTTAVCHQCLHVSDFVQVKGKDGFCSSCLKLVILIEEGLDCDSDGEKVDFKDRETFEGLFMEYYEIVKEKEGLKTENIFSSRDHMKKYNSDSDFKEDNMDYEEDNEEEISDYNDMDYGKKSYNQYKRRKTERLKSATEKDNKSSKMEFVGWGSRSLIEFLNSVGKDTNIKLSQHDVASIVNDYIKEQKLFDPENKKRITCDANLKSLFGRRTINKYRIYDLLELHFTENQDESDEDDLGNDSERNEDKFRISYTRKTNLDTVKESQKEGKNRVASQSCFASIIADNMRLVYVKRSLIYELMQQPDSFEEKVIGSFVRVKSDPNDPSQKNSHQLLQVQGIKNGPVGENNMETILLVSSIPEEVSINLLSDLDFSEGECEDLREKVKSGLLTRPTVVEFERKARILHKDITKHWINKQLDLLQILIDRAYEKGWRRELAEHREKRKRLQTPAEQSQLLENVPVVIPELESISAESENEKESDEDLKSSPQRSCISRNGGLKDNRTSEEKLNHNHASAVEEKQPYVGKSAWQECIWSTSKRKGNASEAHTCAELPKNCTEDAYVGKATKKEPVGKTTEVINLDAYVGKAAKKEPVGKTTEVINLDDEEDKNEKSIRHAATDQKTDYLEENAWYILDKSEKVKYSLSLLKRWSEKNPYAFKFKVWREDQTEEDAIWLKDALQTAFPKD